MGSDVAGARTRLHAVLAATVTIVAVLGVTLVVLPQETRASNRPITLIEAAPAAATTVPAVLEPVPPTTLPHDVDGPDPAVTVPPTTTPPVPPTAAAPVAVRALFLGDSVAWTTAVGLRAVAAASAVTVDNAGIWGCGVVRGTPYTYFGSTYPGLPNDCDHWPAQWQAAVDANHPDVAVVMVGRWELMDRMHDGRWTHIGDPAFDRYLLGELQTAIAVASSRGAKVALCTTPYYRRGDAPGGATWPEDQPVRVDQVNALIRQAAASAPGVATLVDLGGHLSPEGRLAMTIDGVRIRTDGVHMAPEAGPWLAPWFLPQIRAAAGR